jgi:hypothetical protein
MDEQNGELEHLKQLMQDLFVIDLKAKADELRVGIMNDYEKAVKRYKEQFDSAYEDNYKAVNKIDIDILFKKLTNVLEDNKSMNGTLSSINEKTDKLSVTLINKAVECNSKLDAGLFELKNMETIINALPEDFRNVFSGTDEAKKAVLAKSLELENILNEQSQLAKTIIENSNTLSQKFNEDISAIKGNLDKGITDLTKVGNIIGAFPEDFKNINMGTEDSKKAILNKYADLENKSNLQADLIVALAKELKFVKYLNLLVLLLSIIIGVLLLTK